MKAMMTAVTVWVLSVGVVPAQPQATPAPPATAPARVETRGEGTSASVPIVRLPVAVPAEGGDGKDATASKDASAPGGIAPGNTAETEPLRPTSVGFQTGGMVLRQPHMSSLKTNGPVELKGPVPRLLKPERRTFGGFLSSFANLFNPVAPLSPAEAGVEEHRYDGRVNRTALPRGFRDERYHEPQALIIGVGLDGEAKRVEDKESAPPKTPVP